MTKYDFDFPESSISATLGRLTNQIWKLIPMRENKEDWEKQLNTLINEIAGLNEIFIQSPQFLQALSKLEGLKAIPDTEFSIYRKTVFETISIIQEMKTNG